MFVVDDDTESKKSIQLNEARSHAILVCGRHGRGKSYVEDIIAEELCFAKKKPLIIIIDPIGIYWTMGLYSRGINSIKTMPVRIIIPVKPQNSYDYDIILEMQHKNIEFKRIEVNPYDLDEETWCKLIHLSIKEPLGIYFYRLIQSLKEKGRYFISDIITLLRKDNPRQDKIQDVLVNNLETLSNFGIFSTKNHSDGDSIFDSQKINILDFSTLEHSAFSLRGLLINVLLKKLFKNNILDKKRYALGLPCEKENVWLVIDEVQQFMPRGINTLSKDILTHWIKYGPQDGLSWVFVTQQPSRLDKEIISQCDIVITHKINDKDYV